MNFDANLIQSTQLVVNLDKKLKWKVLSFYRLASFFKTKKLKQNLKIKKMLETALPHNP